MASFAFCNRARKESSRGHDGEIRTVEEGMGLFLATRARKLFSCLGTAINIKVCPPRTSSGNMEWQSVIDQRMWNIMLSIDWEGQSCTPLPCYAVPFKIWYQIKSENQFRLIHRKQWKVGRSCRDAVSFLWARKDPEERNLLEYRRPFFSCLFQKIQP